MSSPDSPRSRRRIVIWLGLAAALLLAAGAGAYVLLSGGDVSNPNVEFRAEPTDTPAAEPAKKNEDDFVWPLYGYSPERRQYLAASKQVRPPFKRLWSWNAHSLLEFTPVIGERKLYLIKNSGRVYAIRHRTGRPVWARDMGTLAASAPAYGAGRIYVTILKRDRKSKGAASRRCARRTARRSGPGRCRAARRPPRCSRTGMSTSARRTARSTRCAPPTAACVWRYRASGAVKGGLALADGKLYFGDYGGHVTRSARATASACGR